ncbi:hypothetical protein BDK61_0794 [Haloarcula quadrata]|uniref:Uncharacterized protein n=1 Tax=Haloarcula quadrata TaxID=182779 RepID=A0A495R3P6_9EURY|nr:hypothetical protein [Haloarcula quadrata]RKS81508.1 hypothetical protein BDK61_0794 [Haloarcula quadrata]
MEEDHLRSILEEEFSPTHADLERVTRQAMKLDQSGNFKEDTGDELTVDLIRNKLEEADRPIKAGWNWWVGQLNVFFESSYERFQI